MFSDGKISEKKEAVSKQIEAVFLFVRFEVTIFWI